MSCNIRKVHTLCLKTMGSHFSDPGHSEIICGTLFVLDRLQLTSVQPQNFHAGVSYNRKYEEHVWDLTGGSSKEPEIEAKAWC